MRAIINVVSAITLCLASSGVEAQTNQRIASNAQNFSLEGEIKNFTGNSVVLITTKVHGGNQVGDTITIPVKNGRFKYNGHKLRSPYFASLQIDRKRVWSLIVYNEAIKLQGDANDINVYKLSGGQQIDQYNKYRQVIVPIESAVRTIYNSLEGVDKQSKEAMAFREKLDSLKKLADDKAIHFIEQYPRSAVSPYLLWARNLGIATEVRLYTALDSMLLADNSFFKHITTYMVRQRNTSAGKTVPAMSQPDTSGNVLSFADLRGRYFLIDFWASWCVPCRAANPGVVRIYNEFKDKNFTILGVSLDKDKEKWLKAILDDKLTWHHVSDLKYWDNEISRAFGIHSIPATALVDPNGVIIARDLSEKELEAILREKLH